MKANKWTAVLLTAALTLSLAGCGSQKSGPVKEGSIVVGASPSPHAEILEAVSDQLADQG